MARLRYNGLQTTLGGTGLDAATTTITFAAALTHSGGTPVPTITGTDYIPLAILNTTGGLTEIVYLTAYTSGATTGTITRARENTTAVTHAAGDAVENALTVSDIDSPQCRAYPSADVTIPSGTVTVVPLNSETFDSSGMHDNAINNSRITIPSDGNYLVIASISHLAASGAQQCRLHKNGALLTLTATQGSAVSETPKVLDVFRLAAGDYLELAGFQASGSSSSMMGGADQGTFLVVKKLL